MGMTHQMVDSAGTALPTMSDTKEDGIQRTFTQVALVLPPKDRPQSHCPLQYPLEYQPSASYL